MGIFSDLDSMIKTASRVKLHGGVVGKVCLVLIVVAFAFTGIAWSVRVVWISAAALAGIFGLTFPMLWRLVNLADRNPQAAIMDGIELIRHEELSLGMKGNPYLSANRENFIEETPIDLSPEDIESIQEPDTETPQAQDSIDGNKDVHNG